MRTHFDAIFFSLVVVQEADRYLLVEERAEDGDTEWYLPAGGVRSGENLWTAAARETMEESGLIVDPVGILGADQTLADDGSTTKIRMVFLAKNVGGTLKNEPDDESLRGVWFAPSEIPNLRLRDDEVVDWISVAEARRGHPLPKFIYHERF